MMKARGIAIAAAVLTFGWPAGAQPPQQPARDRPQSPTAGTATIKGRVVDGQSGAPLARARVRLTGGAQGPGMSPPSIQTDESGTFAFMKLPAGRYFVQAEKATFLTGRYPDAGTTLRTSFRPLSVADGQVVDGVTVPLFHGGAIAGRVLDVHGDPLENVEVRAMAIPKSGRGRPQMRGGISTNDIGEFRVARLPPGRYLLMVVPHRFDFNPNEPLQEDLQPMPTYYPAALSAGEAQPIAIERGTSITGLDLVALEGVSSVVSGTVIDPSGQPVRGNGAIMARMLTDGGAFGGGPVSNAQIKPDGTFQIKLAPGDYQLEARAPRLPVGSNGPPLVGIARVTVAGGVSDVAIVLGGGATVSGRVVFEGTSEPPPAPTTAGGVRVGFNSFDGSLCQVGRNTPQPGWTFTVEGIIGTCRVQFFGNIPKWSVKAIVHGDTDLMDRPVTFASEQWKNVQIILTDKRTDLTMHVTDEQGNATRDYAALIFSTDKTRWDSNSSRYIRSFVPPPVAPNGVSVGANGGSSTVLASPPTGSSAMTDTIGGMPAGEYYVVALEDIDQESSRDPDVLEQLSRGASRITLVEGAPVEANVRRLKLAGVVGGR